MPAPEWTGRFQRTDRLLRSREFQRVSRLGRRAAGAHFVVLVARAERGEGKRTQPGQRLGVTVSRKVGKAVVRNRLKRRIREWYRQTRGRVTQPLDIVVIARAPAARLSTREIWGALSEQLRATGAEASG